MHIIKYINKSENFIDITNAHYNDISTTEFNPTQVTLEISDDFLIDFSDLLSSIYKISFTNYINYSLLTLPKTITELCISSISIQMINYLPNSIQIFEIENVFQYIPNLGYFIKKHPDLSYLPNQITKLYIKDIHTKCDKLPHSVEILQFIINSEKIKNLYNLPCYTKDLNLNIGDYMLSTNKLYIYLSYLPLSVIKISIHSVNYSHEYMFIRKKSSNEFIRQFIKT